MMNVIFDKLAKLELDDAIEYYELEIPGLGSRFQEEVKRGIHRILEYPDAWAREKDDIRRYILHKYCNFSISAGTAFWIPASAGMTRRISEVQHVIPAEAGIQAFRNVRLAHRY